MKFSLTAINLSSLACALLAPMAHAQIAPSELVAPKMEIIDGNLNFTIQPSVSGRNYQLQWSDSMEGGTWTDVGVLRSGDGGNIAISTPHVAGVSRRFYRIAIVEATPAPAGFSLIPAGNFTMGRTSGDTDSNAPPVNVYVSGFYMARYEVIKELWDEVRAWGLNNGYTDLAAGNDAYASKGANHPVHSVSWHDIVKWCNARSEMEEPPISPCYLVDGMVYRNGQSDDVVCDWAAKGYRLPTEAEWEKAARGGVSGKRFPWGTDTISHSQANYYSWAGGSYDISPTQDYHPTYLVGSTPYTSPVGSFAPNGYGLFDMAGNVWELNWDWYSTSAYVNGASDPKGPASGSARVVRGGSWFFNADGCRAVHRNSRYPTSYNRYTGFRPARSSVP